MPKLVFQGHDDKKHIVTGIKKAADIITATYGGQGGVVMYQPLHGIGSFTKDGFEVSKQVQFPHILENIGAKFVQEACDKIAFKIGDGTTTMATVLSAFVQEAFKYEVAGAFPRDIAFALKYGIGKAIEILKELSVKIKKDDYSRIESIALVASNYDTQIASFIVEAYKCINTQTHNANPVILIEESHTEQSSINIVKGMQIAKGIFSPQFFKKDEKNKMKVEFNNHPYVVVFGKSIARSDIQQMFHIFDDIIKQGKSCLIVASDFSEEVINFFLVNRHNGISDWVCVKTPGFGDGQLAIAQDIAIRTGAKVLCENGNFLPDNLILNDFIGKAEKICVEKDITIIVGGAGLDSDIGARCDFLKDEMKKQQSSGSNYHVEQLNLRMQSLSGIICIIKLGGFSEIIIREMKDRVEDSVHATKHALQSGIVPGGGIDLLYTSMCIKEFHDKNELKLSKYEKLGLDILYTILQQPFHKLIRSCGLSEGICSEQVLSKYKSINKLEYGIDVRDGKLVNFMEKGILNPSAISLGILEILKEMISLFVVCNVFIVETPDEEKNLKEGFNRLS